jgi:hypothetical protein
MQAFIHPSIARFFWSATSSDPRGITWSPYAYCNGTFTATKIHEFTFRDSALGDFIFIDFSGSGVVHLCGVFAILQFEFMTSCICAGGIGAFVLSLFHKLETSKKLEGIGNHCNLLKRKSNDRKVEMVVDYPVTK